MSTHSRKSSRAKSVNNILNHTNENDFNSFQDDSDSDDGSSYKSDSDSDSGSDKKTKKKTKKKSKKVGTKSQYSDAMDSDEEISDASDDYEKIDVKEESQTSFFEVVIKYLKVDDLIKEKQKSISEEIKGLKEEKGDHEAAIMRYLDRTGENVVNIKDKGKLIKTTSETKAAIKVENIREGIAEGLKKEKLVTKDEEALKIINMIMDLIDVKRPVTKREYLKRTAVRKGKGKGKGKAKGNDKGKCKGSSNKSKSKSKNSSIDTNKSS